MSGRARPSALATLRSYLRDFASSCSIKQRGPATQAPAIAWDKRNREHRAERAASMISPALQTQTRRSAKRSAAD